MQQAGVSHEEAPQLTQGLEERVQITAFSDDKAVIPEFVPGETPLPAQYNQQHTDTMSHSIISFLQRPQLIQEFSWMGSDARNTILTKNKQPLSVPLDLMTPMIRNKLDGFTSFRATAVVKLQINAQPFQCGRLIMTAVPMPTLIAPRNQWIEKQVTLCQSLNHVQIDISKQTEVSLRIPFVSPFNSFDLIHSIYPWAEVAIMVYSPLNEVEQTQLQCLVWAHFEDIELGAPTSGNVQPQAYQQAGEVPNFPSEDFTNQAGGVGTINLAPGTPVPADVAAELIKNVREKERKGFLSSIMDICDKAFGEVASWVGLGGVAKDFAATTRGLRQGIASAVTGGLGWSKPTIGHAGETVVIRPTEFFATVDGIDHSHSLALLSLNCIDTFPGLGGTSLDETTFEYLKRIPQYIGQFCFSSATNYNDYLWSSLVAPSYFVPAQYALTYNTNKDTFSIPSNQPTSLHYIISPFAYWTGSLVYTFRFVKTDFHSGRVEISFHPFVSSVDKTRMMYVYRVVVDLRENSEISVVVPYISPQPWKRINSTIDLLKTNQSWADVGTVSTGVIYVRALTPLICANSIISNNVECVVEVRAGDDFVTQAPTNSFFVPVAMQQSGKVYALPGTQETRTSALQGITPLSITGNESDVNRPDTQTMCAGEIFVSYRQLSRRFGFAEKVILDPNKVTQRESAQFVASPMLSVEQLSFGPDKQSVSFSLDRAPTPLSFVGSMFTFFRGGIRFKIYTRGSADLVSGRVNYTTWADQGAGHYGLNFMCPVGYEQPINKKFAEFRMPYYSPTLVSVQWSHDALTQFDQPLVGLEITSSQLPTDKDPEVISMALAAADDMDFHVFLGPPPCLWSLNLTLPSKVEGAPQLFDTRAFDVDPCYPLIYDSGTGEWDPQGPRLVHVDDWSISDSSSSPSTGCPNIVPKPKARRV